MDELVEGLVEGWEHQFDALCDQLAPLFGRKEIRSRSRAYLRALIGPIERKNGWQIAEAVGEKTPDGAQRFMGDAHWDADQVRDALREYVVENLGDPGGVLILDETGFLKKGNHSVGVQRQYSGTAGRIENCQIGVFLCYASMKGAAFVDRELYLPQSWMEDTPRLQQAGAPTEVKFATKGELGRRMVRRALDAGVPCAWVTGDEVYGADRRLRFELEQRNQPFVLAVSSGERLMVELGRYQRADQIAQGLQTWERLSAGSGSKGERLYDWAWSPLFRLQITPEERAQGHWLLVRRSLVDPSDLAYYVVFAPKATTSLAVLARVGGMRWNIESAFERAKGDCGLDEYEVRKWTGWYRYVTLSLLAHAFLNVMRSHQWVEDGTAREGAFKQPPSQS